MGAMTDQKRDMAFAPKGFEFGFNSVAAYRRLAEVNLPSSFQFCSIFCREIGIILEGSATTTFKSGPRKGKTRWIGERLRIVIPENAAEIEQARYERETGKCGKCVGAKQEWVGWDHKTGNKYKTCSKCSGTGDAK